MKFKSQENEKYFFKKFSIMNITAVSLNIYSECLYAEKEGSLYNILIINIRCRLTTIQIQPGFITFL